MLQFGTFNKLGFGGIASLAEPSSICQPATVSEVWEYVQENYPDQMSLPFNIEILEEFMGIGSQITDFSDINQYSVLPVIGSTDVFIDRSGEVLDVSINISDALDDFNKRWVEAHIFAHFLCGHWNFDMPTGHTRQITMFETTGTVGFANKDPMEEECNNYALELLLPEHTLRELLCNVPAPDISYSAAEVPYEAMKEQAERLGIKLCGSKGPDWNPLKPQEYLKIGKVGRLKYS